MVAAVAFYHRLSYGFDRNFCVILAWCVYEIFFVLDNSNMRWKYAIPREKHQVATLIQVCMHANPIIIPELVGMSDRALYLIQADVVGDS